MGKKEVEGESVEEEKKEEKTIREKGKYGKFYIHDSHIDTGALFSLIVKYCMVPVRVDYNSTDHVFVYVVVSPFFPELGLEPVVPVYSLCITKGDHGEIILGFDFEEK